MSQELRRYATRTQTDALCAEVSRELRPTTRAAYAKDLKDFAIHCGVTEPEAAVIRTNLPYWDRRKSASSDSIVIRTAHRGEITGGIWSTVVMSPFAPCHA